MHTKDRYVIDISEAPQDHITAKAEVVFDAAWRFDFTLPASACWTWDRPWTHIR
jgi:hypothetical protein